jgi:hypothetical protein
MAGDNISIGPDQFESRNVISVPLKADAMVLLKGQELKLQPRI